ncbi:MAG: hypothetical protein BGO41_03955 [Clostridiales bacterium 38-18]|nr:MAG: hypothetical protein BGO41_03955 [Clostridiales bacterium 38-18]
MNKKDKFNDKNYIMNCDMPSELFTVKGIKREYRALAKLWHPDISEVKEALYIMSKINALYKEGLILIEQNKFYEKERLIYRNHKKRPATDSGTSHNTNHNTDQKQNTYSSSSSKRTTDSSESTHSHDNSTAYSQTEQPEEIKRSKRKRSIELVKENGKCARFKYLKRVMIELGFMYVSEEYVMIETTKLKRKIFMDSITLLMVADTTYFKINIPNVVDHFDTTTHGYIVLKKDKGVEPIVVLESVMGYLKPLGSRKICEGIFYDLTALKYLGYTSTALDKDLWFIDVNTGKLHNYGLYFYLHEFSSKLCRAPKTISKALRGLKPRDNETLLIELVKSAMIHLNFSNGLKVDDFHRWLETLAEDSLEVSLAESQVFNRSIASVTTHGFDLDHYYATISYQ